MSYVVDVLAKFDLDTSTNPQRTRSFRKGALTPVSVNYTPENPLSKDLCHEHFRFKFVKEHFSIP